MQLVEKFYKLNSENDTLEVCLILFKNCNLKCAFCFQDHSGIDYNYIKSIPENIISQYKILFAKRRFSKITYRIWGGELFSDDITDEMFENYELLCLNLIRIGKDLNVQTTICFSSNLVFTKKERVKNLLDKTNSILATSYDPIYRFKTSEQLALWKENAEYFRPHVVSITLTKQNICKFITEKCHFQYLKNYTINVEYYIYSKLYEFFKPSDNDIFNFYKYCIDNDIWNVVEADAIVKSLNNPIGRYCTCNNSCLYIDGQLTFNCLKRSSNLPIEQFFSSLPTEENYTEIQLKKALASKHCVICKNYNFCRMFCMASVLHESYDEKDCGMYKLYEYIRRKYGK